MADIYKLVFLVYLSFFSCCDFREYELVSPPIMDTCVFPSLTSGTVKNKANVYLSVSSLASHSTEGVVTERRLEMNWFSVPDSLNEDAMSWVGIFNHDPEEGLMIHDPMEVALTKDYSEGYYRTNISFPRIQFADTNLTDDCLWAWIGYIHANELVAKSCVRARPRWMQDMKDIIGNRTLKELMLPGTHNSGSYEPYKPNRDTPRIRYQICQDEDVFNQLVYGIRYLDLRVIFQRVKGNKELFWICHYIFRTKNTVYDVLLQVKKFMEITNEIVIIDFHMFNMGFISDKVDERHDELKHLIVTMLGHHMMPNSLSYSTTLNDMWKSNKRLLVGYNSKHTFGSALLFPGTFHLWGNKETRPELEEFLEKNICHFRQSSLYSVMAEATPTTSTVLRDKHGGLRILAQEVNSHVTKWFRERWWNCANIVSTDYFLGNNIIDVSIDANAKKFL